MEFFLVNGTAPARDFLEELVHGWYDSQEGIDAPCLVRPGPSIPQITMPSGSDLVVTDGTRLEMERAAFGVSFREVCKYHIPELHWENWLQGVPESEGPDQEVEPWLLTLPHSQTASDALGRLWEIQLPFGASAETTEKIKLWKYKVMVDASTWTGAHFCMVGNPSDSQKHRRWPAVSAIGKAWVEDHAGDWFRFEPCLIKG